MSKNAKESRPPLQNPPDEELIRSFVQTRSKQAFESIYDRHASFVYRKCLFLTENEQDAQDLAQDIWIKVYFALDGFRFESSFLTWLRRITINRCFNYLKTKGRFISSEDVEEAGIQPTINNHLDVTKLLSQLSKETRVLLTLKYVEGYSYEEIAEIATMGVSAVKMRLNRAKEELVKYTSRINPLDPSKKEKR
jgi:RNA polymerase sigma-70 factor (ECF subfamily)